MATNGDFFAKYRTPTYSLDSFNEEDDFFAKYREPSLDSVPEKPSLGFGDVLHKITYPLTLPKRAMDYVVREAANLTNEYGNRLPEDASTGQLARAAAGLNPTDQGQGYGERLGGRALEFGVDLLTDPLTAGMGALPKGVGRIAAAAFAPSMALSAIEEGKQAVDLYREQGFSPEMAEATLGAGLSGAFAYGAGRHALESPRPRMVPRPVPEPGISREVWETRRIPQSLDELPLPEEFGINVPEGGFGEFFPEVPGRAPEPPIQRLPGEDFPPLYQEPVEPPVPFFPEVPARDKPPAPLRRGPTTQDAPFYIDEAEQARVEADAVTPRLVGTPDPTVIPEDISRLSPAAQAAAAAEGAVGTPIKPPPIRDLVARKKAADIRLAAAEAEADAIAAEEALATKKNERKQSEAEAASLEEVLTQRGLRNTAPNVPPVTLPVDWTVEPSKRKGEFVVSDHEGVVRAVTNSRQEGEAFARKAVAEEPTFIDDTDIAPPRGQQPVKREPLGEDVDAFYQQPVADQLTPQEKTAIQATFGPSGRGDRAINETFKTVEEARAYAKPLLEMAEEARARVKAKQEEAVETVTPVEEAAPDTAWTAADIPDAEAEFALQSAAEGLRTGKKKGPLGLDVPSLKGQGEKGLGKAIAEDADNEVYLKAKQAMKESIADAKDTYGVAHPKDLARQREQARAEGEAERAAIQEDEGDVEFDPGKFAVRPAPGQKGLFGREEVKETPKEQETRERKEEAFRASRAQRTMFMDKVRGQGVEKKVPEVREAEGPLFKQGEAAKAKAEAERQTTLADKGEPERAFEIRGVSKEEYAKADRDSDYSPKERVIGMARGRNEAEVLRDLARQKKAGLDKSAELGDEIKLTKVSPESAARAGESGFKVDESAIDRGEKAAVKTEAETETAWQEVRKKAEARIAERGSREGLVARAKERFPGMAVKETETGVEIPFRGGKAIINNVGKIEFRKSAGAKHGIGGQDIEEGRAEIVGRKRTIGPNVVIDVVDNNFLDHEFVHMFVDHFATPEERSFARRTFEKKAAAEGRAWDETFADDFNEYTRSKRKPTNATERFFQRIKDFLYRAYDTMFDSKEGLFRKVERGDWLAEREAKGRKGEWRYATRDKSEREITPNVNWDFYRRLGTTRDPEQSGYIRPDGNLVKFTDRSGERLEHRMVGGSDAMQELVAAGHIRWSPEAPGVEVGKLPTEAQFRQIQDLARRAQAAGKTFTVDVLDGLGGKPELAENRPTRAKQQEEYPNPERMASFTYPDAKPGKIAGDIRRFFSGEEIESGERYAVKEKEGPGFKWSIKTGKDAEAAKSQIGPLGDDKIGWRENWFDRFRPFKLMGGKEDFESNPGNRLTTQHSRVSDLERYVRENADEPLAKLMKDSKIPLSDAEKSLYAAHAVEANPVYEARHIPEGWTIKQKEVDGEPVGKWIVKDPEGKTRNAADDFEAGKAFAREASGDEARHSGMSTAEAEKIIARDKSLGRTDFIKKAQKILNDLNEKKLDHAVEAGRLSQKQADSWRETWGKTWLALRHGVDIEGDPIPAPPSGQAGLRGKEAKMRTGAKQEAFNPLVATLDTANRSFRRDEANMVWRNFANHLKNKPELKDVYEVVYKLPKEVAQKEAQNRTHEWVGFKEKGVQKYLHFKNPEHVRILDSLTPGEVDVVLKGVQVMTRGMSSLMTRHNPVFANLTNPFMDVLETLANTGIEHGPGVAMDIALNLVKARRAMSQSIKKWEPRNAEEKQWFKEAEEYRKEGGLIGNYSLTTLREHEANLKHAIEGENAGVATLKKIVELNSKNGETLEAMTRFATYQTLWKNFVKEGMTEKAAKTKALLGARDVTVDFEKSGLIGHQLGRYYAFFNAGLQGTSKVARVIAGNPTGAAKLIGGLVAIGIAGDQANRLAWGDQDKDGINDWDKVPQYVKDNNVMFGSKKAMLPRGWRVFNAIGSNISQMRAGVLSPEAAGWNVALALLGVVNPLGEGLGGKDTGKGALVMATPTVAKPLIELNVNQTALGGPVMPDQPKFGPKKPESQLAFKNVNKLAKAIAEGINYATGGDKVTAGKLDISPESIEHLFTAYSGGLGKTASQTINTGVDLARGEKPPIRQIPVASRFMYEESPTQQASQFYSNKEELEQAVGQQKKYTESYRKDRDPKTLKRIAELRKLTGAKGALDAAERELKRLSEAKRAIEARNGDTKAVEASMNAVYRRANRAVAEQRKKAGLPVLSASH